MESSDVENLLMENPTQPSITFENIYYNVAPTTSDTLLNNNYVFTQIMPEKHAAVIEEEFEMANRLKDYATVTTENVPLQLLYNIGTENIENVKENETLINTRDELDGNTVISEFQNTGITLDNIDIKHLPNLDEDTTAMNQQPKIRIIANKRILPTQNVQNSQTTSDILLDATNILSEDSGNQSDWMDLVNSAAQLDIEKQNGATNELDSYLVLDLNDDINLTNASNADLTLKKENTTIQNLSSSENIEVHPTSTNWNNNNQSNCCGNPAACYNNNNNNYEGVSPNLANNIVPSASIQLNSLPVPSENLSNILNIAQTQLLGCKTKPNSAHTCADKGEQCCVVVCLKTIDQLKQMLSLAAGCNNFQTLSLGCVKSSNCGV